MGHLTALAVTPGEAVEKLKGGNSNWRGPVWFPLNYLLNILLRKSGHILEYGILALLSFRALDAFLRELSAGPPPAARRRRR